MQLITKHAVVYNADGYRQRQAVIVLEDEHTICIGSTEHKKTALIITEKSVRPKATETIRTWEVLWD